MQFAHAVAPSAFWYVPASHLLQLSAWGLALNVPALQLVACALPIGQYTPIPHCMQSLTVVMGEPPERLVVPPGQGSGAAAPLGQ